MECSGRPWLILLDLAVEKSFAQSVDDSLVGQYLVVVLLKAERTIPV